MCHRPHLLPWPGLWHCWLLAEKRRWGAWERGWIPAARAHYSTARPQAPPKHQLFMRELHTLLFFFTMEILTQINYFSTLEGWKSSIYEITKTRRTPLNTEGCRENHLKSLDFRESWNKAKQQKMQAQRQTLVLCEKQERGRKIAWVVLVLKEWDEVLNGASVTQGKEEKYWLRYTESFLWAGTGFHYLSLTASLEGSILVL